MYLNNEKTWILIGDVHGCIKELKKLLSMYGFVIIDNKIKDTAKSIGYGIVLIGDIIDKSPTKDIEDTIDFFYENREMIGKRMFILEGNHERRVWQWLTMDSDLKINEKTIAQKSKFYNTTIVCENNKEANDKFLFLHGKMIPFVEHDLFIATHAPVKKKYMGKYDKKSWLKQIKSESRSKNKDIHLDELMPYIIEEANGREKYHIFAHLGQEDVRQYKNKICIDTGCVYGGSLTSLVVKKNNKLDFISIEATKKSTENREKPQLFSTLD